jgi:hypothetical protein
LAFSLETNFQPVLLDKCKQPVRYRFGALVVRIVAALESLASLASNGIDRGFDSFLGEVRRSKCFDSVLSDAGSFHTPDALQGGNYARRR